MHGLFSKLVRKLMTMEMAKLYDDDHMLLVSRATEEILLS